MVLSGVVVWSGFVVVSGLVDLSGVAGLSGLPALSTGAGVSGELASFFAGSVGVEPSTLTQIP